jgi:hypothetical protein
MFGKSALRSLFLIVPTVLLTLLVAGCGKTTTPPGSTVTLPATTVIIPGSTTTLPAVTVTLPGKITTIAATTVVIPEKTITVPEATVVPQPIPDDGFLPTTPNVITTHKGLMDSLKGLCLTCHGADNPYNQFPMAPEWDGAFHGSSTHVNYYLVLAGSLQDHTGRGAAECLTCHTVAK